MILYHCNFSIPVIKVFCASTLKLPAGTTVQKVGVGDLDGDGKIDVLVAISGGSDDVRMRGFRERSTVEEALSAALDGVEPPITKVGSLFTPRSTKFPLFPYPVLSRSQSSSLSHSEQVEALHIPDRHSSSSPQDAPRSRVPRQAP